MGPSVWAIQRVACTVVDVPLVMGFEHAMLDTVVGLLKLYGLENAPCMLSEDGTAAQCRLHAQPDWVKQQVIIFGCNGTSREVCMVSPETSLAWMSSICRVSTLWGVCEVGEVLSKESH